MRSPASGNSTLPPPASTNLPEGEKKSINRELWQACAGPLVNLPAPGTHVVYFPQGHTEQVAASMKKDVDGQIPNYPNLPSKLLCLLHNVTLHADPETDEVYAQMTLQPVPSFDKEALLRSDLSLKAHKPQPDFFCKALTASDTSTHGGFSVPRRAAEKIFPPLDYSMQPPAQELVARDLHDSTWTFRHIYRGQPKRHLLTTGWSLFVGGKKLMAGDSVLFIRDAKQQLLLGIRRANRQPTNLSSSVLSSDSMHIAVLAAAAHADSNNSPFTVFYNPRASPSEFVIPLAKYYKAVYGQQVSLGMRFRMMFETEESGTRRYMGTITGISDLDPVRWKNSQWRNLQVGWDESTAGERRTRVSVWEIEPVTAPFFICPPPFLRPKRPRLPGMPDEDPEMENLFKRTMPWLGDDPHSLTGLSLMQWMNMQQSPSLGNHMQSNYFNTLPGSTFQNQAPELSRQLGFTNPQIPQQNSSQFNTQLSSLSHLQPQLSDISQQPRQNPMNPNPSLGSSQAPPSQGLVQNLNSLQTHQIHGNLSQMQPRVQQQAQINDNQIQLQLLQRIQQQQLLSQQVNHMNQLHESHSFSRSLQPTQILGMGQTQAGSSSQTHIPAQELNKSNTNSQTTLHFSQPLQMPKIQKQQPSIIMPEIQGQAGIPVNPMSNHVLTAGRSAITEEFPSCSTSPSTNNCPIVAHTIMHSRTLQGSNNPLISSNSLETIHQKLDVKPSINIARSQSQGILTQQIYQNIPTSQADYLDTSSATSVSRSQNDIISHGYPQSILLADTNHDVEVQANLRNNIHTGMVSETMLMKNYESTKDPQQELSSSMVTQSFGVPDMAFNSIDSAISDSSFMNGGAWVPPPQYQRLRTYTKVYKRGAVGRSIDVTRYSGYDELKQDLARMFGVEGQMEDRGRVGWKLVYVDHENDVLLVGDDPWEDFVNCVRCIKILSPQEVQQMSLDGDFGNTSIPNQASTSSDGGNV